MFTQPRRANRRWKASLAVSFVLHAVVIYFLVRPPRPIYITPSQVAFGHGGRSTELVYFSRQGSSAAAAKTENNHARIAFKRAAQAKPRPKPAAPLGTPQQTASAEPVRAGTPYGSLAQGPGSGHDVRPALPTVFPSPAVMPWQIPSGVEGTVVVEVTIDAEGKVTDTRVLKALGYGIEEKVVAALRNWRFRPALMDGRAIPSQQDVYFHFPS